MRKIVHLTAVVSFLITIIFGIVFIKYRKSAALTICITFGTIAYHFAMRLAVGADLIFVIIQRYNRPRIVRMAKRMKRRE